jgi:CRISPR/Cas system CMR-associated protein Cmr5 small subunit
LKGLKIGTKKSKQEEREMRQFMKNDFLRYMETFENILITESEFEEMVKGHFLSVGRDGILDLESSKSGVSKFIADEISRELENRKAREEVAAAIRVRFEAEMAERVSQKTEKTKPAMTAMDQLDLLLREKMKANKSLSYHAALIEVQKENLGLAWQAVQELRGGVK